MLVCHLLLEDDDPLQKVMWCQLYRADPEDDIQLICSLISDEGVWKNDIAIGAAYRELSEHPEYEKYQSLFDIDYDEICIAFTRTLSKASNKGLYEAVIQALQDLRPLVAELDDRLFGFKWKTEYETDEPLFTKAVVIPLFRRMGFQSVRYNHGVYEYGRDVLFAELDKFSRVRHYAAQVKAGSISASNGTLLQQLVAQIDDAFAMPVKGPGKSKQFHVSEVFVVCSGTISEGAIERLNQKLDPRLAGSVHFLDREDIMHLAETYLSRK